MPARLGPTGREVRANCSSRVVPAHPACLPSLWPSSPPRRPSPLPLLCHSRRSQHHPLRCHSRCPQHHPLRSSWSQHHPLRSLLWCLYVHLQKRAAYTLRVGCKWSRMGNASLQSGSSLCPLYQLNTLRPLSLLVVSRKEKDPRRVGTLNRPSYINMNFRGERSK